MTNGLHDEILELIRENSKGPVVDSLRAVYFGNEHPRYRINNPAMRIIAREWMRAHKDLLAGEFKDLLTSLIEAESCTEKMMAGIMMGYASKSQRDLDPMVFDRWLDHLALLLTLNIRNSYLVIRNSVSLPQPDKRTN